MTVWNVLNPIHSRKSRKKRENDKREHSWNVGCTSFPKILLFSSSLIDVVTDA